MMPRTARGKMVDNPYYRGSRTVPYSCVDATDYSRGRSAGKLMDVSSFVASEDYSLKVIMCSPGVSIIGDDLGRVSGEGALLVDSSALPERCPEGFDRMISTIVEHLGKPAGKVEPGTVNLLGLSIMHRDWRAARREMEKFLADAGLRLVASPGAGSTVGDLHRSTMAEFNIVLDPDFCSGTAGLYEKRYGTTTITTGRAPVGFDEVERLYSAIEDATGVEMTHGRRMLGRCRNRAYEGIIATDTDMLGRTFRVEAHKSLADPLAEWLRTSLGMVETEDRPDYLFASGNSASLAERGGLCGKGVDLGFPSRRVEFSNTPVLGLDGAMHILDELFNPH